MNTESLISYPCDYREVTMSGDLSELSLTTGHITNLPDDDTFNADYAIERLHDCVKKAIKEKIEAKLGTWATYLTSVIEKMANNVADAFVIHAEGNEAEVDTKDLISALSLAFIYMPETEAMCKSMLEDKAPYGEEGRENVTDDLSLTVKMTDSLLGDANGDGAVNVADIVEMINQGHVDDNDMIRIITIIMSPH